MILSDFSVKHPAIIVILLAALLLFAMLALGALNTEMIPPVTMPKATIITKLPGAGAREMERNVSRIIENQMATLPGLTELTSSSYAFYSSVTLSFNASVNVRDKLPQIRELLNGILDELPENIDGAPVIYIMEAGAFLPIFSVRIDSSMDLEQLTTYLEDRLEPSLARIDGVSKINLVGGLHKEARITLRLDDLASRKLSALQIYQALQYNNRNIPAGNAQFRERELSFTAAGSLETLSDLENLTVGYADNTPIYLKDVATVALVQERQEFRVRSAGKNYVMVDILKRDEGNTIKIVSEAKKVLEEIRQETNGNVSYQVISDQSETTQRSLETVISAAISGLLLTILVILLVLHNFRATLIISLSIPLSILFAILGLYATGRSLNLLSLSGMTVAIGMIVDNSIVVLETTYRKFKQSGDRKDAARRGADELGAAVLASTVTSICVFAPLLFLKGIIGIIMNDLSLAIVFALGASALVAVVVVPWLSSLILADEDTLKRPKVLTRIEKAIDRTLDRLEGGYRRLLSWVLSHKLFTITLSLSLLAGSLLFISALKISFLPPTDTGEIEIYIQTPLGYSLERTQAKVDELDRQVRTLVPELEAAVYYVGSSSAITISGAPNRAYGRLRLVPSEKRKRTVQDLIPLLQKTLSETIPDVDVTVLNGGFDALLALGTGGQGFQMEIYGPDLEGVTKTASMVQSLLDQDPDVFKTELSVRSDAEQLYMDLSQLYMGSLGVTPYEAGITSRILFSGMRSGKLRLGSKDYTLRLTSDAADRPINQDLLNQITVKTQDGRLISFSAFSNLEARESLSRIDRKNRTFSVEVRGYLRTEDQSGVSRRILAAMESMNLPLSVKYRTAGTSALIGESLSSLSLMLLISIFLIYAVMVIQFERFMQPLIIMASIPFCLIGVVFGLLIFNSGLSMIAMLAIIALGGTVVNNAIVMVDYTNQLRAGGAADLRAAVIDGAATRLRPILMTAMTTLFGVLPMALAHGNGSEVYAPLGQAIFGGLLTSTLITLLIIPILYERLEGRRRVQV
ncbi:efflux RND transporter permease subunit [Gracilinema caldarium]|uniref:efflux RND transporter permease subunit n=1 Tax=Gracilinema caldarium TaxID=215591 RepID=UPI0026EE6158|nr:efflux RND transporter permease subunit [Gracilinema caldarium]